LWGRKAQSLTGHTFPVDRCPQLSALVGNRAISQGQVKAAAVLGLVTLGI
jgi:hypothetical protein